VKIKKTKKTKKTKMASPITCHVLNTLTGTPASGLKATLTLLSSTTSSSAPSGAGTGAVAPSSAGAGAGADAVSFTAVTNDDGRVKEWEPSSSSASAGKDTLAEFMERFGTGERIAWSIKFEIGPWYEERGVESFWPEVEVKFYVKKGERHYHVPVLVGPWTYTTYRGS